MHLAAGNDDARIFFAVVRMWQGDPEAALAIVEEVLEAHPAPPFFYHLALGKTLLVLGLYDEATMALDCCLAQMPRAPHSLRYQMIARAALGGVEEVDWLAVEYENLRHGATREAIIEAIDDRDPEVWARMRSALVAAELSSR